MNIGKKSLLFGVHQFAIHPLVVLLAWIKLYGMPNFKELACIIIHDWGYWFTANMDGEEGEKHPEFAARLAGKWFGEEYANLCLYHSRTYSSKAGVEPSRLCWADKLSISYEPWWLYLPRAYATGELKEYREKAAVNGGFSKCRTNKEWFYWIQKKFIKLGLQKIQNNKGGSGYAN
jgi:hypothetical protein